MFQGSLTALVTPMREDGSIDEAAFARLIDWQIGAGHAGDCAGWHHGRVAHAQP